MILVDVNLLIYAYNVVSASHTNAKAWLQRVLAGPSVVGLAWDSLHAFLRLTTTPNLFETPLSTDAAVAIIDRWIQSPNVEIVVPGRMYWQILSELLRQTQLHGPRVADAQLAALALEHDAVLCTADRDFRRFEGLRVENPLAAATDPP